MNNFPLIVVAAGLVYGCRLAGFNVKVSGASARLQLFLRYVPISVFSALITLVVLGEPERMGMKSAVLLIAGVILWGMRRLRWSDSMKRSAAE